MEVLFKMLGVSFSQDLYELAARARIIVSVYDGLHRGNSYALYMLLMLLIVFGPPLAEIGSCSGVKSAR